MSSVVAVAGRRTILAAFVAAMLVLVFLPARQLVTHHVTMSRLAERLDALQAENATLNDRVDGLTKPESVERLARERLGYVEPGEEAYLLVGSDEPKVKFADLPPATRRSAPERLWLWLVGAD